MEITTTTTTQDESRRAAVNALAIVGFIALLCLGIGLAIYSARYVPEAVSRLGAAVGAIFGEDEEEPGLDVVTATSTLPFVEISSEDAAEDAGADEDSARNTPSAPAGAQGAGGSYTVITTVTQTVDPYGDPDLTVRIVETGYLRTSDTDSFVRSDDVPDGKRGAVKFTVTNAGTNVTGSWKFKAEVPTSPSYTFTSPTQRSLKPGDRMDFVLGFTKGREGNNREITITVDSGRDVRESNERNNEDSARIDIDD